MNLEWHNAKTDPPKKDGDYLTCETMNRFTCYDICSYSHDLYELSKRDFKELEHQSDRSGWWYGLNGKYTQCRVDYWMEIPEAPNWRMEKC